MIGRAGIMVCAATRGTVTAAGSTASSAVMPAATTAAVVSATASTTTVEAATTTPTTVTAPTMLRERSRRGKQRHGSDCAKQNLKKRGPVHVCYLHPTSSQEVRAARTPKPFYNN